MSDELFRRLRGRKDPNGPKYSFGERSSGDSPFATHSKPQRRPRPERERRSFTRESSRVQNRHVEEAPQRRERREVRGNRPTQHEGDRPYAYAPIVEYEDAPMVAWEPPGIGDILADLGLRVLEVALAAGAQAVGDEVAYFFSRRRFATKRETDRWRR